MNVSAGIVKIEETYKVCLFMATSGPGGNIHQQVESRPKYTTKNHRVAQKGLKPPISGPPMRKCARLLTSCKNLLQKSVSGCVCMACYQLIVKICYHRLDESCFNKF